MITFPRRGRVLITADGAATTDPAAAVATIRAARGAVTLTPAPGWILEDLTITARLQRPDPPRKA